MITLQDLRAVGDTDAARMEFILNSIMKHRASTEFSEAKIANDYYNGENTTINKYEKIIFDCEGKAHADMWTANHKIASHFYPTIVDHAVSYLLGNGVMFKSTRTKEKFSRSFDLDMIDAAVKAQNGGISFIFPELQPYREGGKEVYQLRVFDILSFVPIYDDETGALCAGIRFWQLDKDDAPLRATFYELDGYTECIQDSSGEEMRIMKEKRPYKIKVTSSVADGTIITPAEPFPNFPIIPLKNNDKMNTTLHGKRNTVDALDLSESNMVNNVDEGNLIYWVLKNYAGMDDIDDAKFLQRIKTAHMVHIEGMDADAQPHKIEAPFEGTEATISMLKHQLYEDFQAFDVSSVQAGNQTATAIKANFFNLDLKTDKFEAQVTRTILDILKLVGVDDEPSYTRNKLVNSQEEIQSVLLAGDYLDDEYVTKKILNILGDADQFDEIMARKAEQAIGRIPLEKEDIE